MSKRWTFSEPCQRSKIDRPVNETRAIVLMQAGAQANQLTNAIDRAGNITNLSKIGQAKVSFFLKTQKRRVL